MRRPRALPRRRVALGFALGAIAAPLLTWALTEARDQVSPSSALLLFLLLVVCVSAIGGMWPALAVAVGGFLLVNWYFTPPFHTFTIGDPENVLALLVFLAVAVAVSTFVALAARRAAQATRARAKAETLMRLAGTSSTVAILDGLCRAFGFDGAALLHRVDDEWRVESASGRSAGLARRRRARRRGRRRARPRRVRQAPRSSEDARMLEAFAKELAAAIEHEELERRPPRRALAAVNELRTGILSSVSHDLRTPLAGHQGLGDEPPPGRRELVAGGPSASS